MITRNINGLQVNNLIKERDIELSNEYNGFTYITCSASKELIHFAKDNHNENEV